MHIHRLSVGHHYMAVFIQFQFHLSHSNKTQHPPQTPPHIHTAGNKKNRFNPLRFKGIKTAADPKKG
jgi:hypothetical protein